MSKPHVVCCYEQYQDSHEEWAKVYPSLEEALVEVNRAANGNIFGGNPTFKLFELGKEVPIEIEEVLEQEPPPPPKKTLRYKKARKR